MKLEEIKLKNKELNSFTEGILNDRNLLIYKNKKYHSLDELIKDNNIELSRYESHSHGTENYYFAAGVPNLLWTDSISDYIQKCNTVWLLSLVASYMPEVSNVIAKTNEFGQITYHENKKGKDNFFYVSVTRGENNDAVFTIEHDSQDPELECIENLVLQYIPYTDIEKDVYLYLYDGVLMFPGDY